MLATYVSVGQKGPLRTRKHASCSFHGLQSLHHRFIAWTKPDTTTLMLGTLADLARSKSELVAENALLRQQLIILKRQMKRPVCTNTDRMLLASLVRIWKQALFTVQPETRLALASSGL